MKHQKNYLIQMSALGNKFLIADSRWFRCEIPKFLSPYCFLIEKPFEDFDQLSEKSFEERQIFFQKILSLKSARVTDGFIVLKASTVSIPHYDFYNKDGSASEMCGNAACCLVTYGQKTNIPFKSFQLGGEPIRAVKNSRGDWAISLKESPRFKTGCSFLFEGKHYPYLFVEAGVPHAVLEWKSELAKENLRSLAQELRFKNPFSKTGMNVSFYQKEKGNHLKAITFERGVEDFTMACGTGALCIASAFVYQYPDTSFKEIVVCMPGGDLFVEVKTPPTLQSSVKWGY